MNWFANLRIKSKLVFGFLAINLFVLIVGVFSFLAFRESSQSLAEISGNRLPSVLALEVINEAQTAVKAAQRTTLLPGLSDERIDTNQGDIAQAFKRAGAAWRIYAPLPQTIEEAEVWREFIPAWEAWKKDVADANRLVDDYQKTKDKESLARAQELSLGKQTMTFKAAEKLLNELIRINKDEAAKEIGKCDSIAQKNTRIMTGLIIAAALLSLTLAGAITQSVVDPLDKCIEAATKIGRGDTNIDFGAARSDETGMLLAAMKQMVMSINAMLADAEMLLEAAVAGKLATRADTSKHEGAFRKMISGVNDTLTAVTGPLNVAAAFVDRISKGDMPPPIAERYTGDFNTLRNNLNTLVAELIRMSQEEKSRTIELTGAIERAEAANRSKSLFLSSMSHELRTPLNAILGFANILARDPEATQKQQRNLAIIHKSGEHLLAIINDILEIAKIESGKVEVDLADFDLGELTNDVISMMQVRAEARGLQLLLDQSSSFPRFVRTDPSKLRQIIINLVGNAIKFTTAGSVSIRLSTLSLANGKKGELLFEVSDTGIGIAPEDVERVFGPFEQAGNRSLNEGTGLGLAISNEYVQMLGGSISVNSTPGKGSTFRFTIVYASANPASIPAFSLPKGPIVSIENADQCRILIVEDQLENRLLLYNLLVPFGFQLREAADGMSGVQAFSEWQPHLVLMDRRMPVMDGLAATRKIREHSQSRNVVIVAVTAQAFKEEREEMLQAGCNNFLAKPFSEEQLFEVLEKNLPIRVRHEAPEPQEQTAPAQLDSAALARLPESLRRELESALNRADMAQIDALIQRVAEIDASLGKALQWHAEKFDYKTILAII